MGLEKIEKILKKYTPIINREIERYIPREKKPEEAYLLIWDLLDRGGKRFRPALCILSCVAVGGKEKEALSAAVAIEMLHNATLLHDDICDGSEERRGKPCIHKIYGEPLAINAGDVLYFSAYIPLAKMKNEKAREILTKAFRVIGEGQAYDISWASKNKWNITEKDYLNMVSRKTGELIGASCAAGACIGGANKKVTKALYEYGKSIGIAFQIQDDVLNLIGDAKKYGKEIGGDITEGKRTLMVIHTLNNGSQEAKNILIHILSSHTRNKDKIKRAIKTMKENGSIDYAIDYARKIVETSKKRLEKAGLKNNEATKTLFTFADYFINREF